ncbi:hypothetical protein B9J93_20135 [Vibrio sp. V17_P4S1T151]|uniref:hypothetical protein n=1 Tax=unclassified Vibrio TaxID=2614977 RepID=UPI000B8EA673|nr:MULTISPECIES: hypothetical protein [unclassified Vibrio]OXX41375.1 hypothetical protein B9J93_20135 [Vibrio sp. V17_P4S1T151]OXX64645.1 hypothetical protein B9J89_01815 [Vibrio sp. V15_P4S5T153]
MITIENGLTSDYPINKHALSVIQGQVNKNHKTTERIKVVINNDDLKLVEASIRYVSENDSKIPDFWVSSEKNLILSQAVEDVLFKYKKFRNCDHEKFVPAISQERRIFSDGTCTCSNCGITTTAGFGEKIGTTNTFKVNLASRKYETRYDWGKTHLQAGESGIVISRGKGSYMTAFFEAFPKVSGFGTFIRGEGKDIDEAEKNAWEKFQKQLACVEHHWNRKVHGSVRTDGYAQCECCGLRATALEPTTKCSKCEKNTAREFGDGFLCDDHFYELIFQDFLNEENRITLEWDDELKTEKEIQNQKFENFVRAHFMVSLKDAFIANNYRDDKIDDKLMRFSIHYYSQFKRHVFGTRPFEYLQTVPDTDNPDLISNLKIMQDNVSDIVKQVMDKEEKISFERLINGLTPMPGYIKPKDNA